MKIAVVGAGNVMFKDEGIGIYAQKYLELNYEFSKDITIVDGGVLGFKLMTYYQDFDEVIILDTITMKDEKPGVTYNIPAEKLLGLGSYKQNAHEVEIVEMLEICSLLDKMANVKIIGIVPENIIDVEYNISQSLRDNFENFINEAIKELEKLGVKSKKIASYTLSEIIQIYSNPTSQRDLKQFA
jgi:hydrogenase maturation protease